MQILFNSKIDKKKNCDDTYFTYPKLLQAYSRSESQRLTRKDCHLFLSTYM